MILSKEKVPDYWEIVPLGNVCLKATKVKRKEVDIEKELIYLDIGSIDNVTNRITKHKVYKWKDAPSRAQQIVQVGDILFSTVRVYLRNIAKIDSILYDNQICSSGFTVIRGYRDCCGPKYLFAIALYEGFLQPLNELQTGTSYPAVRDNDVFSQLIPLPPLPEQRAIISKIELLFSELDNGIANLKLAQEQLKVYRQAVLKKAFEGELTRKWREQQTYLPDAGDLLEQIRTEREEAAETSGKKLQKIKPFNEVELAELPRLPEEWGWERLEGVGYWTGGGTPPKQNHSYWNNGEVLWVSPKDMKTTLIVDTGDKITKDSIENSSAKWITKDSILFVVRSGIIRRVLPIALAGKNLTTNQDLQSLTLFWGDKKYVFWYCQANEQIIRDKCAKDGTTVDNIEVPRLKSYPIAICSLPEQHAIVQEIETRLSVCDKIEQDIKENLIKAEALRQSILKKAFEGKLLNERELAEIRRAEDWEPAEVLLEKIRSERAGSGKM